MWLWCVFICAWAVCEAAAAHDYLTQPRLFPLALTDLPHVDLS